MSTTNRVTFEGVIGSDVTGVGTVRYGTKFAEYGDGLGMFAFGGGGFMATILTEFQILELFLQMVKRLELVEWTLVVVHMVEIKEYLDLDIMVVL